MKKFGKLFLNIVLVFFIIFGVSNMRAADKKVAAEHVEPNGINWIPVVNYTKLVLTVSRPDGSVFNKIFNWGTTPFLSVTDINGNVFVDGSYSYQLTVIPVNPVDTNASNDLARSAAVNEPVIKTLKQGGHFTVKGGQIVDNSQSELPPDSPMDILHYDDVIITGSQCIGFDCQDGESFGFDTLILKEHNLRIYFNDTSYTASYPTNSWRISINDSTNGGASYFSIDDVDGATSPFRVEAGAPDYSLYVEDYGRVGLGTSTPVVELHIKDSDTPTTRLEQDNSGGWTAQTWDVAGNESNFFVRDATNGSKLPFRIQPSTPSSTLCLKSDGKVGIGTWSPGYTFEVETTGSSAVIVAERTSGAKCKIGATGNQGQFGTITSHPVKIVTANTTIMSVNTDGSLTMSDGGSYNGTWNPASSREYKENFQDLSSDDAIDALEKLNPVEYNYKKHKDEKRVGFIAEDVPDLVAMKGRKTLGTVDILAVLTKVIQEQQKMVKDQQITISELKERIGKLEENQKK